MSKERFDIAIGILDPTENAIERIKNQHKFEKDLSEFLNTNTYSKDKHWVVGMLNQVSEYCKDKIDTLIEQQHRISELEEQLKWCIRPKFKVGQTVYTFNKNTECVYELCIKIIRIEINEISKFNSLVYLAERLEDGNFFGYFEVELFATKAEAIAKLKELGEKR